MYCTLRKKAPDAENVRGCAWIYPRWRRDTMLKLSDILREDKKLFTSCRPEILRINPPEAGIIIGEPRDYKAEEDRA